MGIQVTTGILNNNNNNIKKEVGTGILATKC